MTGDACGGHSEADMTKWPLAGVLLAVGLGVSLVAGGQDQPTFRVETRVVEVDVFVTDSQGRFVRDLTGDDFEILEDGERHAVSSWTLVDLPVEEVWAHAARGVTVDADVTTNAAEGRLYVMLLDSPGLHVELCAMVTREQMFRFTQRVGHQFVDEFLGPHDRMAVIHVQGGDGQALTGNRRLIKAAIDRLRPDMDAVTLEMEGVRRPSVAGPLGGMGLPSGSRAQQYCDMQKLLNSYHALEATAERLGAITGRRKAILWVNGRIPFDPVDECAEDDSIGAPMLAARYRDALRAATRHNVAIYPIDSIGLTADPNPRTPEPGRALKRMAALRTVAEDTGGEAIVNTNNFGAAYEQVVRANSTYYLLAYHPQRDHRDGRFHSITVRVNRPGVTVRARRGYIAPPADGPVERSPAADALAALASPLAANGLGLRLFAAPFRGTGREASVLLGGEVHGVSTRAGSAPRVELAYLAMDADGRTRTAPPLTMSVVRGGAADAGSADLHFTDRLVLPPGRYELRMVVHQPGGATGSVVTHLEIPDFTREPLAMSGLVLAAAGTDGPVLYGDARLESLLGMQATTLRRFSEADVVTAFAEVYTDARTGEADLRVQAKLSKGSGAPLRSVAAARVSGGPDRVAYTAELPLTGLVAGDYVLTLEAHAGRRTVNRRVPIAVVHR
jgi:VWFA-related protein